MQTDYHHLHYYRLYYYTIIITTTTSSISSHLLDAALKIFISHYYLSPSSFLASQSLILVREREREHHYISLTNYPTIQPTIYPTAATTPPRRNTGSGGIYICVRQGDLLHLPTTFFTPADVLATAGGSHQSVFSCRVSIPRWGRGRWVGGMERRGEVRLRCRREGGLCAVIFTVV